MSEPVTTQTFFYDKDRDVVVTTTTVVAVTEEPGEVWRNRKASAEAAMTAIQEELARVFVALGIEMEG